MDIEETTVDWRSKGFWLPDGERTASWYATARPGLFDGGFTWPLLTVRESAARRNIDLMAAYARRHDVQFAPHAKTTMAPGLIAAQLSAGAWGMTVATPNQALVLNRLGVPRVFIANEVLDPVALQWLASVPDFEVYLQVDSLAGVAAAAAVPAGRLRVLVELGHAGGRTGARTVDELSEIASAVAAAPRLSLAGITGYEGQLPDAASVDAFLDTMVVAVSRLKDLLPAEPLVSAGGSAWFDRVVARLSRFRVLLRSGASVTHDDGFYRERTPFLRVPDEGPLTAALQMWAQVISTPEPGLAIVGMGKRDAPFDEGLPVVHELRRGGVSSAPTDMSVTKMNDHHTYVATGPAAVVPGDLLRFGLSHPCTAFDKWRDIPVVDDDHHVVDVLHTYF
ncbi:alanine racemase [Actinoplanes sp. NPDC051343]|uniref:alanine racemase n=1 Tax=Actinoplanes sp. NPDC051343 TaxID=3363906 RepID=UPI0037872B01